MRKQSQLGFTLIEVVLAIAVGLIIIAGVSVGYSYAKRAVIADNQRKETGMIKAFVEQAISSQEAGRISSAMPWVVAGYFGALQGHSPAAVQPWSPPQAGVIEGLLATTIKRGGLCNNSNPPCITQGQLAQLATTLKSLGVDPYTGATRQVCGGSTNSCYWTPSPANSPGQPGITGDNDLSGNGSTLQSLTLLGVPDFIKGSPGSRVVYINFDDYQANVTFAMADGTTRKVYGYVIIETDDQDNIVAAEGGSQAAPAPAQSSQPV